MLRKLVPLAVAVALVVGCGKKNKDEGGGGGGGGSGGDPNATYTIKLRETPDKGDKYEVTDTEKGLVKLNGQDIPQDRAAEYTETVLEVAPGAERPTKLTRAYKTANRYDFVSKGPKPVGIEGKTLAIEKKGPRYEFTAGGNKLGPLDTAELDKEFNSPKSEGKRQELVPAGAVKVGEPWVPDAEAVKRMVSKIPYTLDHSKTKATGKLEKAYTQDGRPWGRLVFAFDLVVADTPKKKPKDDGPTAGTIRLGLTLDAPIDGSSAEGTTVMTVKMELSGNDMGSEIKMSGDFTRTKTVKSVK